MSYSKGIKKKKEGKLNSKSIKTILNPVIILVGNPNTGKSVIFNNLTGLGVTVSNYPGTTVELAEGVFKFSNKKIRVIDLPGTYSLSSNSMDQIVARNKIIEMKDKAIFVNILDASNLERNLILTLELIELKIPTIICLNMIDEAKKRGIKINYKALEEILGVPVIPTIAIQGKGIDKLIESSIKAFEGKVILNQVDFKFGKDIEIKIELIKKELIKLDLDKDLKIPFRAIAIKLIEKDELIISYIKKYYPEIFEFVNKICFEIEQEHGESASIRISKERNSIATNISDLIKEQTQTKLLLKDKIDSLTTKVSTGVPIMVGVWIGLLSILIFGGGFIEEIFVNFWDQFINFPIETFLISINFNPAIQTIFVSGILLGIEATLAVIIPYVALFYILLAIIEDTGYLTRMAFLMDSLMHKLGLHGKSVIPIIAGFGCSVPAIMGTRILESKREKIIASFLITLIPCAARTSVILGVVGANIGFLPVMGIYGLIISIVFISGYILNKFMKGERTGLVIEMPPYRLPKANNIFKKTWLRLKDFISVAIPIIVIGSIVLGALSYFNILGGITIWMAPLITGLLGLPAITGVVLFFGILRKELALIMLIGVLGTSDLLAVLTPVNLIVFSVVISLYIPCLATFAAINKELGLKNALLISVGTIILAFIIGGGLNYLLVGIL